MKLCVFSDSHGNAENMVQAVLREAPDSLLFLGDGEDDLRQLRLRFPGLTIQNVRGNCDVFSASPLLLHTEIAGKKLFLTHGHRYNVKSERDYRTLRQAAREAGADLALFGHTHRAYQSESEGLILLNPGSIGYDGCYGLLCIDGGRLEAELKSL